MQDQHSHSLKIEFAGFPPGRYPFPPGSLDYPITIHVRNIDLKHALALILEQAECQATFRGETLVVSPQPIR